MDGKVLLETNNYIVRVTDPIFVGYSISKHAGCAAKVVPKAYPTGSVGVVTRRSAKFSMVECTEISAARAEGPDTKTGELLFRAGNIVYHFYTTLR
jgi:UDP-N-acetylglucosamine/UDP-N-acetylgalactosamine diphosphorylase